jgi:hypothetical protein
MSLIPCYRVLG